MTTEPNEAELAASYALSCHVPDMARGFAITTSYGTLTITSAEAHDFPMLGITVERILRYRLHLARLDEAMEVEA